MSESESLELLDGEWNGGQRLSVLVPVDESM